MNRDESERLWALVRRLQRAPEALDDVEARRALTVLTASRSDAAYLLLQRVLVLETALEQIRQQRATDGDPQALPAPSPAVRAAAAGTWRPSAFLRDAAVIATGVVGGGLVLDALDGADEAAGDAVAGLGEVGGLF